MGNDRGIAPPPAPSHGPVVVGIDRSAESLAALRAAMRAAAAFDASLTVVHAVGLLEDAGYREATPIAEIITTVSADPELADVGELAVEVVSEDGPATEVLLRVAERLDAGMIVVGRRGAGAARRPLGSVSEAVVGRASVPVLVVPAGS